MNRTKWIDGYKGILCIGVFLHHFLLAFYPTVYTGDIETSHNFLDLFFSKEPFSVIHNGNFFVCCFLVISGMMVTKKIFMNKDLNRISSVIIKRYTTLSLSLLSINLITLVLIKFGFYNNTNNCINFTKTFWLFDYNNESVNITNAIKQAFIVTPFFGGSSFGSQFWMVNQIMLGTILVSVLCLIVNDKKIISLIFVLIPIVIFILRGSLLLCYCFGFLITYFDVYIYKHTKNNKIITTLLLILGLFLGSFPSGIAPTNKILVAIDCNLDYLTIDKVSFIHSIAASILIFGLVIFKGELKLLEKFEIIGIRCFSIFLLNEVVIYTVSTNIFYRLIRMNVTYDLSVIITLLFSIIILLVLAYLYDMYLINWVNCVSNKILVWLEKNESTSYRC